MESLRALEKILEAYFAAVAAQSGPTPPPLRPHMEALEAWEIKWSALADPMLRHFLQRRSYSKALAHLRGQELEGQ